MSLDATRLRKKEESAIQRIMVINRLWDVSAKASDWYSGSTTNNSNNVNNPNASSISNSVSVKRSDITPATLATSNKTTQNDSPNANYYWDYASDSVNDVAETISKYLSTSWNYYETSDHYNEPEMLIPKKNVLFIDGTVTIEPKKRSNIFNNMIFPWTTITPRDIAWLTLFKNNPYNSVTGRQIEPSSMSAVRDLIALVPSMSYDPDHKPQNLTETERNRPVKQFSQEETFRWKSQQPHSSSSRYNHQNSSSFQKRSIHKEDYSESSITDGDVNDFFRTSGNKKHYQNESHNDVNNSEDEAHHQYQYNHNKSAAYYSPSETASHLAEGTIRALRDLSLDEAVELQDALRFWTERWERPVLSWLEAGPTVWFSRKGYNHQEVGRKVSQIQAVLARRCASIGELQEHILTAGWTKGVAQWGCLGQGSTQWAAVAGFENIPEEDDISTTNKTRYSSLSKSSKRPQVGSDFSLDDVCSRVDLEPSTILGSPAIITDCDKICPPEKTPPLSNRRSRQDMKHIEFEELPKQTQDSVVFERSESIGELESSRHGRQHSGIFVRKKHGGGIFFDDPGFLALWSVQTIALVRRHLHRAGNGMILLPCQFNWTNENLKSEGELILEPAHDQELPEWAGKTAHEGAASLLINEPNFHHPNMKTHVTITDLPAMVDEVQELLDIMQDVINVQRRRRLKRLQAPSWFRCNWYIIAALFPPAVFFARNFDGRILLNRCMEGIKSFYRERLRDPLMAIANELLKGRENFSDKKARMEAMTSLKKMILSWLEDSLPDMPASERLRLAEAMDISLIERKKIDSLKAPFYDLNNVVRMSFIEMQYMKKEMMNALYAMDEMMSANDINMNIAAVTPGLVLGYFAIRVFRFFTYALLKLGTSREETYASFRNVLADIERLLIMRDNPPRPYSASPNAIRNPSNIESGYRLHSVLESDDLGMLMLLIHECRSIMWRYRRRFSQSIIRSVSEDLAELAGERGAVSVQQQLRIIERMCRSYPFLKVISTGHQFQYNRFRNIEV